MLHKNEKKKSDLTRFLNREFKERRRRRRGQSWLKN